ncbi:hypothetical protein F4779DRAFT_453206 [Xylariaceae sp. FL0662B]|nr:hypothetical protein F4779DRAFT_453206 [Xylariaceae sp. FL0662B]
MHIAQVESWSSGPRYITVNDPPAPASPETQVQLRVLATGAHQVVRSRASGKHYSARALPHTPGVDCVGADVATGQLYYYLGFDPRGGTFVEYLTADRSAVYALPADVNPVAFAASVNPAMSAWMALTQRARDLPPAFEVVVLGATSASGRMAVRVARALGAGRVVGVARNKAALAEVDGLDACVALADLVSETDFSGLGDCDVVLDYVYGDAAVHLLSSLKTKKPVQYVQVGSLSGRDAALPASLLRSLDLTIRGSGPGAWRLAALQEEMRRLIPTMLGWKLLEAYAVPLKDIETAWDDKSLASKGRVVFVP